MLDQMNEDGIRVLDRKRRVTWTRWSPRNTKKNWSRKFRRHQNILLTIFLSIIKQKIKIIIINYFIESVSKMICAKIVRNLRSYHHQFCLFLILFLVFVTAREISSIVNNNIEVIQQLYYINYIILYTERRWNIWRNIGKRGRTPQTFISSWKWNKIKTSDCHVSSRRKKKKNFGDGRGRICRITSCR